jgi:hypothetical protein
MAGKPTEAALRKEWDRIRDRIGGTVIDTMFFMRKVYNYLPKKDRKDGFKYLLIEVLDVHPSSWEKYFRWAEMVPNMPKKILPLLVHDQAASMVSTIALRRPYKVGSQEMSDQALCMKLLVDECRDRGRPYVSPTYVYRIVREYNLRPILKTGRRPLAEEIGVVMAENEELKEENEQLQTHVQLSEASKEMLGDELVARYEEAAVTECWEEIGDLPQKLLALLNKDQRKRLDKAYKLAASYV